MGKGLAITIGVNLVDKTNFYSPKTEDLAGCVHDATDIHDIAKAQGFEVHDPLTDSDATRKAVLDLLQDAQGRLHAGDTLLVHYSGHGMLKDLDGAPLDEHGDTNSCWCLHDRPLSDNELYATWFGFEPGVKILVISDSCHSGTATKDLESQLRFRGLTKEQAAEVAQNNPDFFTAMNQDVAETRSTLRGKEIGAQVLLYAGCQDDELSGDLPENGVFTSAIKAVWGTGYSGTLIDFFDEIKAKTLELSDNAQTPNFFPLGGAARMAVWTRHKPFTF